MRSRIAWVAIWSLAAAGVILRTFHPDNPSPAWMWLAESGIACVSLALAFYLAGIPAWGPGAPGWGTAVPVAPSGVWVTSDTPLRVGDRVLAPGSGYWWRAEVVAVKKDRTVKFRYIGWGSEHALDCSSGFLQLEQDPPQGGLPRSPQRLRLPAWLLVPFLGLALLGLILSVVSYLCGLLQLSQPLGEATRWVGVGIVLLPLGLLVGGGPNSPGCPTWLMRPVTTLGIYSVVLFCAGSAQMLLAGWLLGQIPNSLLLRCVSGCCVLFYLLAAMGLYSAVAGYPPAPLPDCPDPPTSSNRRPPARVPTIPGGATTSQPPT